MPTPSQHPESFSHSYRAALAGLGITLDEALLLETIRLGPVPEHVVCKQAWSFSREFAQFDPVDGPTARVALESCFQKQLLCVTTAARLNEIAQTLLAAAAIGPIYGLPQIGDADFTDKGAAVARELTLERLSRCPPGFGYEKSIERRDHCIYASRSSAVDALTAMGIREPDQRITEIGPWRRKWWERFSRGFLVEFE